MATGFAAHHPWWTRKVPNPRMLELVEAEWARLGNLRDSTFSFVPGRAQESVHEHENIVRLIEQGAPLGEIEEAARRHGGNNSRVDERDSDGDDLDASAVDDADADAAEHSTARLAEVLIDHRVYTPNRVFRMPFNTKYDANNHLRPLEIWTDGKPEACPARPKARERRRAAVAGYGLTRP